MYQGIVPSPDSGFKQKLKTFDPTLTVEFDRNVGKFVIKQPRRLRGGQAVALVIENNDDRPWRQPDERDLVMLRAGDFEHRNHKDRIREGENRILDHQAKQEKEVTDTFREASRDDKIQIKNAYRRALNDGKVGGMFRRVTPKSKGYTVTDRRKVK